MYKFEQRFPYSLREAMAVAMAVIADHKQEWVVYPSLLGVKGKVGVNGDRQSLLTFSFVGGIRVKVLILGKEEGGCDSRLWRLLSVQVILPAHEREKSYWVKTQRLLFLKEAGKFGVWVMDIEEVAEALNTIPNLLSGEGKRGNPMAVRIRRRENAFPVA